MLSEKSFGSWHSESTISLKSDEVFIIIIPPVVTVVVAARAVMAAIVITVHPVLQATPRSVFPEMMGRQKKARTPGGQNSRIPT
jgi:hypothetical protein